MSELEDFKTDINLSEYAASQGYEMDRRMSSRNSVIMRHPDGDKIIVARGHDRHWIYFSVRSDRDNGSIIDFVQNRTGGSLGDVRQTLRPWIGKGREPQRPPVRSYAPTVEPTSKEMTGVIVALGRMQAVISHPYLERRGLPTALLSDPGFPGGSSWTSAAMLFFRTGTAPACAAMKSRTGALPVLPLAGKRGYG